MKIKKCLCGQCADYIGYVNDWENEYLIGMCEYHFNNFQWKQSSRIRCP